MTSAGGDKGAPRGRDDWYGYVGVVGIYLALGSLCLWGAMAWNSIFMLVFSGIWFYMAVLFVLWFFFVPPEEEDE